MNRRRAGRRHDRPSAEGDEALAFYVSPCGDTFVVYEPHLYNSNAFSKSFKVYKHVHIRSIPAHLSSPPP
jgi:hypothetical protein